MRELPAKQYWFSVIKAVERHHNAALLAVAEFRRLVESEGRRLPTGLTPRDLVALTGGGGDAGELGVTFFVRLFAAFEEACRRCWIDHIRRASERIGAEDLLNSLQHRYPTRITPSLLTDVHAARNYRNDLVHLNREHPPVSFRDARRRLARFLSGLPDDWLLTGDQP